MTKRRSSKATRRRLAGIGAVCLFAAAAAAIPSCTAYNPSSFDPKTCMESVPRHVRGLQILQGPRTEQSIIRDMVPAVCNAQVLFRRMNEKGAHVNAGRVLFRVTVEYTGEVYGVTVAETTVESKRFIREVSDFIMDTDFVGWARHDTDTIFLYPVIFEG